MSALSTQAVLWEPDKEAPCAEKLLPVFCVQRWKPRGGFWSSTWTAGDAHASDWARFCHDDDWGLTEARLWTLEPDPAANVYEVDTYAHLRHLHLCYGNVEKSPGGYENHYLDWSLIAERYDAVHLTEEGQWQTRLSDPYDLYGWDCESTLWFRWMFTAVHDRGVVSVRSISVESQDA